MEIESRETANSSQAYSDFQKDVSFLMQNSGAQARWRGIGSNDCNKLSWDRVQLVQGSLLGASASCRKAERFSCTDFKWLGLGCL